MTREKSMISKIPARAPIYFSALMAVALMLAAGGSAQAKFNLSSVGPDYGCLLRTGEEITQQMQLHTDKKGKVESGAMSLNIEGSVCTYTLTSGSNTIDKTNGTGTATLTWTFSSGSDSDDESVCAANFGTTFTEHFAFVIERSGNQIDLAMLDPGLSGAKFTGSDPGDFPKFGSCTKQ